MNQSKTKKLALAGILCAVAVVGSMFSFPVFGSKCAPVQHMVNVLCAVLLGPWYGVGVAFVASLLRNLLGLGSLMAFPGSMCGALLCGIVYHKTRQLLPTLAGEVFGTGILGRLAAMHIKDARFPAGLPRIDTPLGEGQMDYRPLSAWLRRDYPDVALLRDEVIPAAFPADMAFLHTL